MILSYEPEMIAYYAEGIVWSILQDILRPWDM